MEGQELTDYVPEEATIWSAYMRRIVAEAGWTPGRRVTVDPVPGFAPNAAANAFIEEFGGLSITSTGAGLAWARLSVELDPHLALGMEEWFADWMPEHGSMYPVGEAGGGHAVLTMNAAGDLFMLFHERCLNFGDGRDGLARILEGSRPLSDQEKPVRW